MNSDLEASLSICILRGSMCWAAEVQAALAEVAHRLDEQLALRQPQLLGALEQRHRLVEHFPKETSCRKAACMHADVKKSGCLLQTCCIAPNKANAELTACAADTQALRGARPRMAPSGIQSQRRSSGGQLRGSWALELWVPRLTGPASYLWLRSLWSWEPAWRLKMLRAGRLCTWPLAAATGPWCSSSLRSGQMSTVMMVLEVRPPG